MAQDAVVVVVIVVVVLVVVVVVVVAASENKGLQDGTIWHVENMSKVLATVADAVISETPFCGLFTGYTKKPTSIRVLISHCKQVKISQLA